MTQIGLPYSRQSYTDTFIE